MTPTFNSDVKKVSEMSCERGALSESILCQTPLQPHGVIGGFNILSDHPLGLTEDVEVTLVPNNGSVQALRPYNRLPNGKLDSLECFLHRMTAMMGSEDSLMCPEIQTSTS